jgi:hypothetical protein
VNSVMNFRFPYNAGILSSGSRTGGLSSSAQLNRVSYSSTRLIGQQERLSFGVIPYTLKMEATRSSETSVCNKPTRRHISEDGILHSDRREDLKSYTVLSHVRMMASQKSKFPTCSAGCPHGDGALKQRPYGAHVIKQHTSGQARNTAIAPLTGYSEGETAVPR